MAEKNHDGVVDAVDELKTMLQKMDLNQNNQFVVIDGMLTHLSRTVEHIRVTLMSGRDDLHERR